MESQPFEFEFNDLSLNAFRQGMLEFFDEERLKRVRKQLKKVIKKHAKPEVFEKLTFYQEFKVSSGDSIYGENSGPVVDMVEKNDFDLKIEYSPMQQTFYYYCKGCGTFSFDPEFEGGFDDFLDKIGMLEMSKPKKMRSREQQIKEAIQTYSEDLFGRLPKPPKYE